MANPLKTLENREEEEGTSKWEWEGFFIYFLIIRFIIAGDIDMLMELIRVESSGDLELALGFAHVEYEWEILNFI